MSPLSADTDVSYETWRSKLDFNQQRLQQLDEAHEKLLQHGLSKRDFGLKTFIKLESYPCYKYPRLINSRSDVFKTYFGPYARAMEEEVYKLPYFIKHVPVLERPFFLSTWLPPFHKYIASDYSKFERHFIPEIMAILELQLYQHMLRNFPGVYETAASVLTGTNHLRGVNFLADIVGCRMSGEVTTSLANGFSNLMLFLFVCYHYNLADPDDVKGVVEGDDALFALPGALPNSKHFADLGFEIKIEIYDTVGHASFCGLIFDLDSKEIIRDPVRFLCKFMQYDSNQKASNRNNMMKLLRAKLLSGICESPSCPVLWSFFARVEKITRHIQPKFERNNWYFQQTRPDLYYRPHLIKAPSPKTRQLFAEKFGISLTLQYQLEDYFSKINIDDDLNTPLIHEMFLSDTSLDKIHYYNTHRIEVFE